MIVNESIGTIGNIRKSDTRSLTMHSIRRVTYTRVLVLLAITTYLVYSLFAFDVVKTIQRANIERFALLSLDSFFYKVQIDRRLRVDDIMVSIEGDRNQAWSLDNLPYWIEFSNGVVRADLGAGYWASIADDKLTFYSPETGIIEAQVTEDGVKTIIAPGIDLPAWVSISELRFEARPKFDRRVMINRGRLEIQRYFFGWENFLFGFHSPLNGLTARELISFVVLEDRVQSHSNFKYVVNEFLDNPRWQHRRVLVAIYETFLMAFLGTVVAVLLAAACAFLAAANFSPSRSTRFVVRRIFDFVRSVDSLIWSLIFIRAFGLGPLTGAFAIAITMFGELGKLFSEALEDLDRKQIEGVMSTGASRLQVYRYGVLPQILPIITSQSLYYFEVNVRSATIIGALGAGGIGLVLVQYMQTTRNWENVIWIIILIILLVVLIDSASSRLRRRFM